MNKDMLFFEFCKNFQMNDQNKTKLIQDYKEIKTFVEEKKDVFGFDDWSLEYGVFYEMLGKIVALLQSKTDAENLEAYSKIIQTITRFNEYYRNVLDGHLEGQINKLTVVLNHLNSFYQQLSKTTDSLLNWTFPTFRDAYDSEPKEDYLNYMKENLKKAMIPKKEEMIDDYIFGRDTDTTEETLSEPKESFIFEESPEKKYDVFEDTSTPLKSDENNKKEDLFHFIVSPEDETNDFELSTNTQETSLEQPVEEEIHAKSNDSEKEEDLFHFITSPEETETKDLASVINSQLENSENVEEVNAPVEQTNIVAFERIKTQEAPRITNREIHRSKLERALEDIGKSLKQIQRKVQDMLPLTDQDTIYYNLLADMSHCFSEELRKIDTLEEEEIPDKNMTVRELYEYLKNGRKVVTEKQVGKPYHFVRKQNNKPVVHQDVPIEMPWIDEAFTLKEGAFAFNNGYLTNTIIPLFDCEETFRIKEIDFQDQNANIIRAFTNEQVENYLKLNYRPVAVSQDYYVFYNINDIQRKENLKRSA